MNEDFMSRCASARLLISRDPTQSIAGGLEVKMLTFWVEIFSCAHYSTLLLHDIIEILQYTNVIHFLVLK